MSMTRTQSALVNNVKMVVWDLDDTFWRGTLSEGGVVLNEVAKNCIITLSQRGIVSSICSKNDFEAAKAELKNIGVWDYFVFPRIEYAPKGQTIAALIEEMNLRAENVLFLDDNHFNREEAKHYAPGLIVAEPAEILPFLLDLPQLAGKDDPELTRLKQYKRLETKSIERSRSVLSNEDFLRQCGIEVTFDYDLEKNFHRIVELANRTNQLNFTKRRLEKPEAIDEFRALCESYGIVAGVVRVSDKYGDYGVVGYFVARRLPKRNELLHFAFSCRTMNMGVEQYVYESLGEPDIRIVRPISNPIRCFAKIDWIKKGAAAGRTFASARPLVLLGGCELLQLASICSSKRTEFVNTVRNGRPLRFDDAGFILGDREKIGADPTMKTLSKRGAWSYFDAVAFDKSLQESQIVIVALLALLWENYFVTNGGVMVRLLTPSLKRQQKNRQAWFAENLRPIKLTTKKRLELVTQSLDRIAELTPPGCNRFVFGANSYGLPKGDYSRVLRTRYNDTLKRYCRKTGRFNFVDVESLVKKEDQISRDHFTRGGYLTLANFVSDRVDGIAMKKPLFTKIGAWLSRCEAGRTIFPGLFATPRQDVRREIRATRR